MSSTAEDSFRSSLRGFNFSGRSANIQLPTDSSSSPNASTPFASFRDSASNLFSNVSRSVQGYMPLNVNGEEEEEPWYQMSRVEVGKCRDKKKQKE